MMTQKPPIALPSNSIPVIDPRTGVLTPAWRGFLSDMVSAASPIETVTFGASPVTFTAVHPGSLLVSGGTVTQIQFVRGRITIVTGLTAGFIPMSEGDQVIVTYAVLPNAWYLPSGNPA